jgi:hypothetical protein
LLHEARDEREPVAADAPAASEGTRPAAGLGVDRSAGPAGGAAPRSRTDGSAAWPAPPPVGSGPGLPAPAERAAVFGSTRARMVAAYLVLLVVAGAVAVLGIRQILLVRLDNRTEAALRQEVAEVRTLVANGDDPATGQPFGSLERAFDVYMERNVPSPKRRS